MHDWYLSHVIVSLLCCALTNLSAVLLLRQHVELSKYILPHPKKTVCCYWRSIRAKSWTFTHIKIRCYVNPFSSFWRTDEHQRNWRQAEMQTRLNCERTITRVISTRLLLTHTFARPQRCHCYHRLCQLLPATATWAKKQAWFGSNDQAATDVSTGAMTYSLEWIINERPMVYSRYVEQ